MRRFLLSLIALGALMAPQPVLAARAPVGAVTDFGPNLAATCPMPEGIAIDPKGSLYAASFAFKPVANICVVDRHGQLVDVIPVPAGKAGVASLLGELFEPGHGLYVLDFANGTPTNGRLLQVNVQTHAVAVLATGFQAPNAIAQDRHRNLFVSDSFQGAIFKVAPDGSSSSVWLKDARLLPQPGGSPPFGANGVAFDRHQRFLYVATTSDSKIYRVRVKKDGSAGPMELFASGAAIDAAQNTTEALHGADGIMFDVRGNLYVCANSAQHPTPGLPGEIQVLSPQGKLIARYDGTGQHDLDFPASLVFRGRTLYITNLALDTAGANSKLSAVRLPFAGLPLHPESSDPDQED